MLRNLVSSLIEHEQITTTVAKAKEAQKLAEKLISTAKKGEKKDWEAANSFLLNPKTTLKTLFTTLSTRYASRPGGYTRLTRAGFRVGDHAPLAILELVDSPNDIKFEQAARTVGREMAIRAQEGAGPEGWWEFERRVLGKGVNGETKMEGVEGESEGVTTAEVEQTETDWEAALDRLGDSIELSPLTRKNVLKTLSFRLPSSSSSPSTTSSTSDLSLFLLRSHHHYLSSLASFRLSSSPIPDPDRPLTQLSQRIRPSDFRGPPKEVVTIPLKGRRLKAGERVDGWESVSVGGEEGEKVGGPITRAKGSMGRYARRLLEKKGITEEEARV